MEEKINLVKKYKMSVDLVSYNILGKRITKPEDEYCLIAGRKMQGVKTIGMENYNKNKRYSIYKYYCLFCE